MEEIKLYKHPVYGHVYGPPIVIPKSRVCWPSLLTAKPNTFPVKEGDTPGPDKFELTHVVPIDSEAGRKMFTIMQMVADAALELYNKNQNMKLSLTKYVSDYSDYDLTKIPFYNGCFVVQGKNKDRPVVKGFAEGGGTVEIDPAYIEGGMVCRSVVTPILSAKGFGFRLEETLFIADDGVRFGNTHRANYSKLVAQSDGDEEGSVLPAGMFGDTSVHQENETAAYENQTVAIDDQGNEIAPTGPSEPYKVPVHHVAVQASTSPLPGQAPPRPPAPAGRPTQLNGAQIGDGARPTASAPPRPPVAPPAPPAVARTAPPPAMPPGPRAAPAAPVAAAPRPAPAPVAPPARPAPQAAQARPLGPPGVTARPPAPPAPPARAAAPVAANVAKGKGALGLV